MPSRRRRWFNNFWRASWTVYLRRHLGLYQMRDLIHGGARIELENKQEPVMEKTWHGLPEAELTDEQEREGQRRIANEWHRHND
jgi:hypothetical protein